MKGSGTVRIGRDFFFDPRFDPVQVALVGLGIPTSGPGLNGRQYNNAHIMRWYVREFGEDSFRQLAYQQWRENVIDGEPRSRAAVFMAKLWKVRNGKDKLKSSEVEKLKSSRPFNLSTIQPFNRNGGAA